MPCKVGSIREVHKRLVQEGYAVSEYALRQWVKGKRLRATYSGNKALISYNQVIEFLNSDDTSP